MTLIEEINARYAAQALAQRKAEPVISAVQSLLDDVNKLFITRIIANDVTGEPRAADGRLIKEGEKMSGGDLRRRVRKETGMDNDQAKALLEHNSIPKGDNVVHKHDAVERVRQAVHKIKSGDANAPESLEPSAIAHKLFMDGPKKYGLEKHISKQNINAGGYVKEANATKEFTDDYEANEHSMKQQGFWRYTNNWGQDTMRHTVPTAHVTDELTKLKTAK